MSQFVKRALRYLKKNSIGSFIPRAKQYFNDKRLIKSYYEKNDKYLAALKVEAFEYQPLISIIVPMYNTPERYFNELVDSIMNQVYENWELCLADGTGRDTALTDICKNLSKADKRVKYRLLDENKGISGNTNEALKMATGEFVFLADHDDLLEVNTLYECVKAFNENEDIDSIYSDEDKIGEDKGKRFEPHFKPGFNLEYLRANNYICHIFVTRRSIALDVGGFCSEYDGAQDYDFILKCCEKSKVVHQIPKILYHWRSSTGSTATNPQSKLYAFEAGAKAIEAHFKRCGIKATVENDGLNYGYYVSHRDPDDEYLEDLCQIRAKSTKDANRLIKESDWEYIFLCDEDIIKDAALISKLLDYAVEADVAAVTCKIISDNNRIIQGPIVLDSDNIYRYKMYNAALSDPGYFRCMMVAQNVTLADYRCIMIKKSNVETYGGLDESLPLGLAIFDYCLRAERDGQRVVFTPYDKVVYKGRYRLPKYEKEAIVNFRNKWSDRIKQGDKYESINSNSKL